MTYQTSYAAPAIEAEGLVKKFGDNLAVDGVDLQVATGSIYGVLGPNGAGKTTTIRMLATLLKPDAGTGRVFGHDIRKEPNIVRQLIGVTGQYASVDETLSATENLVVFGMLLGLNKKQAKVKAGELLEEFDLTAAANRAISKFSGGMRRRLDLAASLISQPPLIFLDEPTTGLDPITRNQMWVTIQRLVTNGSTVLLTTQYLDEADQLADRIAVIDRGKVIAEGTPGELKASIGSASLELKLSDRNTDEDAIRIVRQTLRVEANISKHGVITAPMSNADQVTDLLIALRNAGVQLAEVSVRTPTLDEVFLALTGHATDNAPQTEMEGVA